MERFARSFRALVALAVCGSMTGCGGYGALCADAMDCEGGNDADVDACVVTLDYYEERASLDGCEPEWDELYACVNDEASCRDNNFSADGYCDRERDRWVDCVDIGFNF